MRTITVRNVNHALYHVSALFNSSTVTNIAPRGARTLEWPEPVTTVYKNPRERLLFCPVRRANPFFHLYESLWILAGQRDVKRLAYYNRQMEEYSDDGDIFHGAYGFRLSGQITKLISLLQDDPHTRRAVLQIWDHHQDLDRQSKDIPCNTIIFFKVRKGALNMTVCNRSNDALWGAYGANVVQFSMIQEYIANHLELAVGTYRQVSDSFHIYPDTDLWKRLQNHHNLGVDLYSSPGCCESIMGDDWDFCRAQSFGDPRLFDRDLFNLFHIQHKNGPGYLHYAGFSGDFFRYTVTPMMNAWAAYVEDDRTAEAVAKALHVLDGMEPYSDWRWAAIIWLTNTRAWMEKSNGFRCDVGDSAGIDG